MKLYTSKELAKILGIHYKTVERLGREGKLERLKVGRSVRFIDPTERMVRNGNGE